MELLRAKAKVDISHMPPVGPSQFIMLKPVDKDSPLASATIRVEDPEMFLKIQNGEEVIIVIEKPIEQ